MEEHKILISELDRLNICIYIYILYNTDNIIYIYISITVVWQLCDHSCNTRASSFCSPENVGEQGYVDDHDFDDQLEQHPFPTMCPSCSEIRSNKEPKHRTNHHKINELDNTR